MEEQDIWDGQKLEHNAIHAMGADHQKLVEEAIGNLAALELLGDDPLEHLVKNS